MVTHENLDLGFQVRVLAGQPWFDASKIATAIFDLLTMILKQHYFSL